MPEVYADNFRTTLATAIPSAARPVTFTVDDISPQLAGGSFAVLVYDADTDADPQHAERLYVTATAGASWTAQTEGTDIARAHAAGSVVLQILTARSLQQPLTDHIASADPHTGLIRKASIVAKGDMLVGSGAGAITRLPSGPDGTTPIADSSRPSGWRMGAASLVGILTGLGDLVMRGFGGVQRLAGGTVGQVLTMVDNAASIADPGAAPTTSDAADAGTWAASTLYQIGYTWQVDLGDQGMGETLLSPLLAYTSAAVPLAQNVATPAAPAGATALLIYAGLNAGAMHLVATLDDPLGGAANAVLVTGPDTGGAAPPVANTTGGLTPAWADPAAPPAAPAVFVEGANQGGLVNGDTIQVNAGETAIPVTPDTALTGIILTPGTVAGWEISLLNIGLESITFAASGSNVLGDSAVPPVLSFTARKFVWDGILEAWVPVAA